MTQSPRIITFDLETRLSPEETGWGAARRGEAGISILVARDGDTYRYFDDHTLDAFADLVESPEVVLCGYNVLNFDIPVIESLLRRSLRTKHVIDLYDLISRSLDREHRSRRKVWKLGMVAKRTMGLEKLGNGAMAPDLCAAGRIADLVNYCRADVDLTAALADYVRRHGGVLDDSGDLLELDIPDWFRLPAPRYDATLIEVPATS